MARPIREIPAILARGLRARARASWMITPRTRSTLLPFTSGTWWYFGNLAHCTRSIVTRAYSIALAVTFRADNWQDTSPEFIGRFPSSRIESSAAMGKPLLLEEWGSFPTNRDGFMRNTYDQIESAMQSGGLQGSAFWQWYMPGQLAAASEQSYGPGGMYGIYESDPIWSRIVENAKFTQTFNSEMIPGCSLDDAKKADVPALASCEAGKEGPTCGLNVKECLRGLDNCHENAACMDTDEGFTCECYYGYTGDGTSCVEQQDAIMELQSKYYTTPQTVSCQLAIPVDWPITVPGGLYDPLDSQQYVIDIYGGHRGSGDKVNLLQCMVACQMDVTCESFVINEVQGKCLLTRGQVCIASLDAWHRDFMARSPQAASALKLKLPPQSTSLAHFLVRRLL